MKHTINELRRRLAAEIGAVRWHVRLCNALGKERDEQQARRLAIEEEMTALEDMLHRQLIQTRYVQLPAPKAIPRFAVHKVIYRDRTVKIIEEVPVDRIVEVPVQIYRDCAPGPLGRIGDAIDRWLGIGA